GGEKTSPRATSPGSAGGPPVTRPAPKRPPHPERARHGLAEPPTSEPRTAHSHGRPARRAGVLAVPRVPPPGILERSFFAVLASAVRSSLRRYRGHGRCTNRWMATAGAASSAAEPDASLDGGRLAQRLGEIAANAAPENVLEPALRAIVAESGAAAGALCFFDSRQELLRLAAEVGLSDDGCRQLRCVRRGAATGWDIPLHGLLNR